ncbi:hypothetical protein KJ966_03645 [bacterium]|nr:hypothetical protein [bacterium]
MDSYNDPKTANNFDPPSPQNHPMRILPESENEVEDFCSIYFLPKRKESVFDHFKMDGILNRPVLNGSGHWEQRESRNRSRVCW